MTPQDVGLPEDMEPGRRHTPGLRREEVAELAGMCLTWYTWLEQGCRDRDGPADAEQLAKLCERYDEAAAFGITHNRHRDWLDGNHPGYVLGCWLQEYADQVWLFTRQPAVDWTNNVSEQGAKAAKRHQAVSGYWRTQRTLARWCRIRSYLDSAAAHGITALDAITTALAGNPWLPAPAAS